jgi:hypothetical protein
VFEQARAILITRTPLPRFPWDTKTSMRNTSKDRQSRRKQSRPLLSQLKRTVTDSHRLGEARTIAQITTIPTERLGGPFATFNFRYRSRSKSSCEVTQVRYSPWQRICKLYVSFREAQVLSHWKIDQKRVSIERSFLNCCVDRRYI